MRSTMKRLPTTSKSIYFLMEIIIMLLFFAFSSAVCIQFVMQSKQKSEHGNDLRFAMLEGTNVMESIQATNQIPASYTKKQEDEIYQIEIEWNQVGTRKEGTVSIEKENVVLFQLPFMIGEVTP